MSGGEPHWGLLSYPPPLLYGGISLIFVVAAALTRAKTLWLHGLLLVLNIALVGGVQWNLTPATDGEINVLTLNALGGGASVDEVAAFINEEKIDVVCLQETVTSDGMFGRRLLQKLPDWNLVEKSESAILSRYRFRRTETVPVKGSFLRHLIVAELDTSTPVTVVSVHWPIPQFAGEPQKIVERLEAAEDDRKIYLDKTLELVDATKTPVIVAGDFNTPPLHVLYKQLDARLDNAFEKRGVGFGYTFPADRPVTRIDHIWTSAGVTVVDAKTVSGFGSDHRGVTATVNLGDR